MNDDRGELRRVERNVVRMVVLDTANHVLLLQTRDLCNQTFGTRGNSQVGAWSLEKHTSRLQ